MYHSRQESKKSAPGTSQQSSSQSSKKRSKGKGHRGGGAGRGTAFSQGSVRPPTASSDTQSIPLVCDMCRSDTLGSVRDTVHGVSTMAKKAISFRSVLN